MVIIIRNPQNPILIIKAPTLCRLYGRIIELLDFRPVAPKAKAQTCTSETLDPKLELLGGLVVEGLS